MRRRRTKCLAESGISLVEVLLAGAMLALIATAATGAALYGQEAAAVSGSQSRALSVAEEGLEAVKNMRDAAWSNLPATDGTYYLSLSGNQWSLGATPEPAVNGLFSRQISLASESAAQKLVTSTVTWPQTAQRNGSVSLVTRLSNWLAATFLPWQMPSVRAVADVSGTQDALRVRIQGNYAYILLLGTPAFVVVDISDPSAPVQMGTTTISGSGADLAVSGNYAYVTSSANSAEFQVISIADPSNPSVVATFNASGTSDGEAVAVAGNRAYFTQQSTLRIMDISNPTSPTLLNGSGLALGAVGYTMAVSGNYGYIASASDSQELQVVNISNPAAPSLVAAGHRNLPGTGNGTMVMLNGSTLYIGQQSGGFHIYSIAAPAAPSLVGNYTTITGSVYDIAVSGDKLFVAAGDTSNEFQVFDISVPATPSLYGSYNYSAVIYSLAYDSASGYVYAATAANTEEVVRFEPF